MSLGDLLARSTRFKALFDDGMGLVEEASSYLDGPGRNEARGLTPALAAACSAESMRLTTRLMQIASWLLIRRAVTDGEMSDADAQAQRIKITISAQARVSAPSIFMQLPAQLQTLTERSLRLQQRVLHLDQMVNAPTAAAAAANQALEQQHSRLRSAYPGR